MTGWVIVLAVLALTAFAAALALRRARTTFEKLVDLDTPLPGERTDALPSPRGDDTRAHKRRLRRPASVHARPGDSATRRRPDQKPREVLVRGRART